MGDITPAGLGNSIVSLLTTTPGTVLKSTIDNEVLSLLNGIGTSVITALNTDIDSEIITLLAGGNTTFNTALNTDIDSEIITLLTGGNTTFNTAFTNEVSRVLSVIPAVNNIAPAVIAAVVADLSNANVATSQIEPALEGNQKLTTYLNGLINSSTSSVSASLNAVINELNGTIAVTSNTLTTTIGSVVFKVAALENGTSVVNDIVSNLTGTNNDVGVIAGATSAVANAIGTSIGLYSPPPIVGANSLGLDISAYLNS